MSTYFEQLKREGQKVNPLFAFLGMRLISAGNGEAEIRLPVRKELTQGVGLVAGGILATLADETMAHAALADLPEGLALVTSEMNIRYLRSADPSKGGELAAKARIVKQGRQVITVESSVFDLEGRLLATAGGSFWLQQRKLGRQE